MVPRRVLVISPFGVGDVIFTMALVEAMRGAGVSIIGFLCNERTVDLVRMNTAIDRTFVFNRDRYRKLWKRHSFLFYRKLLAFLSLIKEERYEAVLDLSLGSQYAFFAMFLGIRERIGFDYRGRGIFLTKKIHLAGYEGRPVADIQLDLLGLFGISRPKEHPQLSLKVSELIHSDAAALLRTHGFQAGYRLLAVAPGGGRSWGEDAVYKQWDPERFARAADDFCSSSASPTKAILLGECSETGLLEKVKALMKMPSIVVSSASLDLVSALLLRSNVLLCNDGGLMHLANALGVKTVSIFGPVDEKVYGPFGGPAPRVVLTQGVPCRPCYSKFHFPPCSHERRCLTELSIEAVVQALKKIA